MAIALTIISIVLAAVWITGWLTVYYRVAQQEGLPPWRSPGQLIFFFFIWLIVLVVEAYDEIPEGEVLDITPIVKE